MAAQNNCQEWDRPAWKSWCCQAHQLRIHDRRTSGTILQVDVRTWRHWEWQRHTTSEGKGMDVKDVAWSLRYIESLLCKFNVMLSLWPYQLSDRWRIQTKKSRKEKKLTCSHSLRDPNSTFLDYLVRQWTTNIRKINTQKLPIQKTYMKLTITLKRGGNSPTKTVKKYNHIHGMARHTFTKQ